MLTPIAMFWFLWKFIALVDVWKFNGLRVEIHVPETQNATFPKEKEGLV
jgi:hypothetical protein